MAFTVDAIGGKIRIGLTAERADMFQYQFIAAVGAIVIFLKIQSSTDITDPHFHPYLNMSLRLLTVELSEFF